jgi:hypothetical protein
MRGDHYVVISSTLNPAKEWETALRDSMGVTTNFKAAYHLALSIGEIAKADVGYKGALVRMNKYKAVMLKDELGSNCVTIVNVRKW